MPVPRLVAVNDAPSEAVIRTLLMTDLVDSTRWVQKLGDSRASEVAARHDRAARDLLPRFKGLEIDKTDGFLLLFERPIDALAYALAYHQTLSEVSAELDIDLQARAGIHLGEILLRQNSPADVERGAKRLEAEGLAKPTAARVMSLARGRQTLLTQSAFDLARRSAVGRALPSRQVTWLAHGPFRFKGVDEPMEIFEAGEAGFAPLSVPPDSEKARRVVTKEDEVTLGWRPAPALEIPQRSHWTLEERLGAGGFGEVWLARHKKTGDQHVFKFCLEPNRLRSLQREVTLFRLLKETLGHRDDIARILDWNFDTAPYFLESDYTEGGSLVDWAEEQGGLAGVPLTTRLELVAQVAEALAAAHSVGILHKDVKPSNILVATDRSGQPAARLADFGIGLVVDHGVLADHGITVLGMTEALPLTERSGATGTYLYMAPEVIGGKPATIQADLYSLGVILYQMVAGDFGHPLSPGWRRDVADEILADDIARIVDGSPERRPASATEVADGLRRLDERKRLAQARRERDRAHRRRKIFAAFGAVATVVLLIVSFLAVQAIEARREAERRRGQAEDLIGFMLGDLRAKLRPLGSLEILDDVGDRALEYFASVPAEDLTDEEIYRRSRALMQIGQLRIAQGRLDDARAAFEDSFELVRGLVAKDPSRDDWQQGLGSRHYWIGSILWDLGDLDAALERFEAQLAIARHLAEKDPQNPERQVKLAYAYNNVGFYLRDRGDLAEAVDAFRQALETKRLAAESAPEDTDTQTTLAYGHNALGAVLLQLGELDQALESFESEEAIVRALLERKEGDTQVRFQLGVNLSFMGLVLEGQSRTDAARSRFQESLDLLSDLVETDPTNTTWRRNLAGIRRRVGLNLKKGGDLAGALNQVEQSVEAMTALAATDPERALWQRDLALGRVALGEVLEAMGDLDGCLGNARTALGILEPLAEQDPRDRSSHRWLGEAYILVGRALAAMGDEAKARQSWRRATEVTEYLASETEDVEIRRTLARARNLLGETDESETN